MEEQLLKQLREYNRSEIEASLSDMELDDLIVSDIATINDELKSDEDIYDKFPIVRFYRGDENTPNRAYALDSSGGIGIFVFNSSSNTEYHRWQIVVLGEDDGYFFLNSRDLYCSYYGNKIDFLYLLSEAISMINNNVT